MKYAATAEFRKSLKFLYQQGGRNKDAVDEYHKEIFKFVDEYVKVTTKARKMLNKQDKIFKKWRNKDGSKAGD